MYEKCEAIHIIYCKIYPGLYKQSTNFKIVKIEVFLPTDNEMLVFLSRRVIEEDHTC